MLGLKWARDNVETVKKILAARGVEANLDKFLGWDEKRRRWTQEVEKLKHRQNLYSKKIGELKSRSQSAEDLIEEMQQLAGEIKDLEKKRKDSEERVKDFLLTFPNILSSEVPLGKDNVEERSWGKIPSFDFKPRDHQRLGEELGILDFKRAAKVAGSGFVFCRDLGARLERALINFMLDLHLSRGYREILPPFMTNRAAATGTGQLPKFQDELYCCEKDDYYLIPTAEVPVTNLHRDEVLKEEDLPLSYVAYTPCFRREAGASGKKVQGIIRQHQFNKVELVKFTTSQTSYEELEKLLSDAEEVLKRLELAYRVVRLSASELSFSAAFGYDIEVWVPSQEKFLEISTCSNYEDFQARRASIKYRSSKRGNTHYVHTLNGSGLAVGRTVVAILENFQDSKGEVTIPEVLRSYMNGVARIEKG